MRNWMATGFAAALVLCALPAFGGPTDKALFGEDQPKDRVYACYTRHYDDAHLAGHPKQNVTDMKLLVDRPMVDDGSEPWYTLVLGVNFRGLDRPFGVSGGCSGGDGKTLLDCGIDCDGGQISVRLRDANSVLVDIPYGASTWDAESGDSPPEGAAFGADDKLFRLDRTDASQCESIAYDEELKARITAAAAAR